MSDTNLSKNDLEEICRGFRISTEGTKAELVQRIRDYSSAENRTRPEQTVKSKRDTYLVGEEDGSSRGKTKIPRSRFATPQDEEGQSSQHHLVKNTYETLKNVRKCRLHEEDENEVAIQ
ncbi:7331_t:CDS:2, partial [Racocetra persica]